MNHLQDEALARYVDNELSHGDREDWEAHLDTCSECQAKLADWQDFDQLLRETFPKLTFQVVLPRSWWNRRRMVAAAAAALVLFAGIGWAAVAAYRAWTSKAPAVLEEEPPAAAVAPAPRAAATPPATETPEPVITAPIPAPAPSGKYHLSGTVMNAQYEPLVGARIAITRRIEKLTGPETQTLASTASDADGQYVFSFDVLPSEITVSRPGYMETVVYRHAIPEAEKSLGLDVLLFNAPRLSGIVTDTEGNPLAGVTVASGDIDYYGVGMGRVQTDAGGHFECEILAPSTDYPNALHFIRNGYSVLSLAQSTPGDWVVALPPVAPLEVHVRRDGKPVAGALAVMALKDYSDIYVPVHRQTTNEAGIAVFSSLLARHRYDLVVADPADAWPPERQESVLVGAGSSQIVSIEITRKYGAAIHGRIVFEDGSPVPGAAVNARDRYYETDTTGAFVVPVILGEQPSVSLNGHTIPGFEPIGDWGRSFNGLAVHKPFETEFVLKRGKPDFSSYSIVDEDDNKVTEVILADYTLYPNANRGQWNWHVPACDSKYFSLGSWRMAIDPLRRRAGLGGGAGLLTRLELDTPTETLEGFVRDSDGEGVPFLVLSFRPEDLWTLAILTQTDASGYFVIHDLPKQKTYSVYTDDTAAHQFTEPQRVSGWEAGTPIELLAGRVVPTGIQGLALFEDRTAAVGASIEDEIGRRIALADNGGRFNVYPDANGLLIRARISDEIASEQVFVTPDTETLRLILPNAVDLRVAQERMLHDKQFKVMGLVFAMFKHEHDGGAYPLLSDEPGVFAPDLADIYPEYLADLDIVGMLEGQHLSQVCYLGYVMQGEQSAMQMLDAYEAYGPEGIRGQDLEVAPGKGTFGTGTIFALRENVTELLGAPAESRQAQFEIPVLWEIPGTRESGGGWVLYMDGHVEWQEYPGRFPMTEAFIKRLRALQRAPEASVLPK